MLAGNMTIREIIKCMRHDGGGGRAGRVELLTDIEGVLPRPGAADHRSDAALMTPIVRTSYRYKYPPRRKKPVAIEEGPA
jgi:hypothetical protein